MADADRKLTIVQLSSFQRSGGAEMVALSLHRLYRQLGHDSILVLGHSPRRGEALEEGVLVMPQGALARKLNAFFENRLGWVDLFCPASHRLRDLVGRPWDVLHAHNLHRRYFDLAALTKLSHLAPVVLMMHDNWLQTGHCAYHLDCERWLSGCGQCPRLDIYPPIPRDGTAFNWRRKRRLLSSARLWLTAPSQWLLDEAGRSLLAGKPARMIPNGTDLETFRPGPKAEARAALDLPADAPLVLFSAAAALANPFKDGPTLLAALGRLVAKVPAVRLVALGGETLPPVAPEVAAAVIARPFDEDPQRVAAYYRAADVLAHATRTDNAPLVLLEAMACGTPVVASAVGGIPEYVEDGKTGLLVPPGDPAALAQALTRVLNDQALAATLSREGLAAARERYDIHQQATSYLNWYRELSHEERVSGRMPNEQSRSDR